MHYKFKKNVYNMHANIGTCSGNDLPPNLIAGINKNLNSIFIRNV
jgi:hypothetical protein